MTETTKLISRVVNAGTSKGKRRYAISVPIRCNEQIAKLAGKQVIIEIRAIL